uniref:Lysosomal dipeptide transporter MFSD1 n=1 Tax=Tetraodon nigroviridis TaxID=99883 RepID=H3C3X3_TETNG
MLGIFFCYDIPSALQDQFQGNLTCPKATEAGGSELCVRGLGMTPQQYNLLFVVHSWASVVVTLVSGFLIDKLGNFIGICLSSFLSISGTVLFALGSHFRGTAYLLPLMLTGRLLLGSGIGSMSVLQDCITAFWFEEKELAMAFGVTIGFSHLGSILNFFVTQIFEQAYGLQWTLWGGTLLCVFSAGMALIAGNLDRIGVKQLGLESMIQEESSKIRIGDVKRLPLRYFLLTLSMTFFYNIILPFIADASKFFLDKFSGYSQQEANSVAGAVYICALVFTTVAGCLIDFVGLRVIILLVCAVLTLPVLTVLAFTNIPPLICTILLGMIYSFVAASTWPSIVLVVPRATVGTAIGLTTAVSMAGTGVSHLIIGAILDTSNRVVKIPLWRWQWMMIYLIINAIGCIISSVLLNIVDHRQGGILNKTRKKWKQTKKVDDSH